MLLKMFHFQIFQNHSNDEQFFPPLHVKNAFSLSLRLLEKHTTLLQHIPRLCLMFPPVQSSHSMLGTPVTSRLWSTLALSCTWDGQECDYHHLSSCRPRVFIATTNSRRESSCIHTGHLFQWQPYLDWDCTMPFGPRDGATIDKHPPSRRRNAPFKGPEPRFASISSNRSCWFNPDEQWHRSESVRISSVCHNEHKVWCFPSLPISCHFATGKRGDPCKPNISSKKSIYFTVICLLCAASARGW